MSGLGQSIVVVLGLIAFIGVIMFATAFKRPYVSRDALPRAQLVEGATSPIEVSTSGRRLRVSASRVAIGVVLVIVGGGGLMFVYAWAGLAQMANH